MSLKILLRIISDFMRPNWRLYLWGFVGMAFETALWLIIPVFLQDAVDSIASKAPGSVVTFLVYLGAVLTAVGLIKSVAVYFEVYFIEGAAERVGRLVRSALHTQLQRLSPSFFDRARTGDLMSRMTSDVTNVRDMAGFGLGMLVFDVVLLAAVFLILFVADWRFALVALSPMPVLAFVVVRYSLVSRPAFDRIQQQTSSLTSVSQETVSGIRVVKAFAQEPREQGHFQKENMGLLAANMRAAKVNALYQPGMDFLAALGSVLVIWFGGRQVVSGALTVGQLVGLNVYVILLIWPIRSLGWIGGMLQRGLAGGYRIYEILDRPPLIEDAPGAAAIGRCRGEVEFQHVDFGYGETEEETVLQDFSLKIAAGEAVGILGATGSGKSSIASLILRFYEARGGRISLDGLDITGITLESLRGQVGYVPQDVFLFSASIRENIAYGAPGAGWDKIEEAAKAAQIHAFIAALPHGYDTLVGERGIGLSGGQKQRLAIARALLLDPPILIFDDATSSVDARTEKALQATLRQVMRRHTTIVISQKISSVRDVDRIVVLKDGTICEQGTHVDLMAAQGFYRKLHDMQAAPNLVPEVLAEDVPDSVLEGGEVN